MDPEEHKITAEAGDGQVMLTWKAIDGVTKYKVYKIENGSPVSLGNVSGTTYTVTGLTNGTEYGFYVRGVSGSTILPVEETVYATPTA